MTAILPGRRSDRSPGRVREVLRGGRLVGMMETVPDRPSLALPPGFRIGTATSAYQVEGAAQGRGPSIWDTFTARPGTIRDGSDGSVACDSYHRYTEDADLVAGLGLDWYRFSVAWPRIVPAAVARSG